MEEITIKLSRLEALSLCSSLQSDIQTLQRATTVTKEDTLLEKLNIQLDHKITLMVRLKLAFNL